jgi:hypothetical protein
MTTHGGLFHGIGICLPRAGGKQLGTPCPPVRSIPYLASNPHSQPGLGKEPLGNTSTAIDWFFWLFYNFFHLVQFHQTTQFNHAALLTGETTGE